MTTKNLAKLVGWCANVDFSSCTDSGMTTFMRALGPHINPIDRIYIAETSFELNAMKPGKELDMSMSQLCQIIFRNNPDRVIVCEIRSKEALEVLISVATKC